MYEKNFFRTSAYTNQHRGKKQQYTSSIDMSFFRKVKKDINNQDKNIPQDH